MFAQETGGSIDEVCRGSKRGMEKKICAIDS